MQKPFTMFHRLMLLALALGTGFTSWGQVSYQTVPLTAASFNADVIANGSAAIAPASVPTTGTNVDVEGGWYFPSVDYNTATAAHTSGLPTSRTITNSIAGFSALTYQLAPYTGNNSLRIPGTGVGSGTVTFATPTAASEVYVLSTSGGAASTVTMVVNFSDNSTQTFTGESVPDWFQGTVATRVFGMTARVNSTAAVNPAAAGNTAPFLFQNRLVLPAAKVGTTITGITFNKTSTTGYLTVMGVSLGVYPICGNIPTSQAVATTTSGGATPLTSACSTTSIFLSLQGTGVVTPSNEPYSAGNAGYTYQWQKSTDNANWTDIAGATSSTYTATQTVATYYRCSIACLYDGIGGIPNPSTSVFVDKAYFNCYCTPANTATNEYITNVTLGNINNTTANPAGQTDYSGSPTATQTTTLNRGGTYGISVSARLNASGSTASAWIDYDHSGTYDASEFLLIGTGPVSGTSTFYVPQLVTVGNALTVPTTALLGATKMRVRWRNGSVTGADACVGSGGETEDYLVTIAAESPCSGAPTVTATGPASICPGVAFSVTAGGLANSTSNVTYQWQSSPAGANTFTNISTTSYPSAATATLTIGQAVATDYQVIATCAGVPTTSSAATVALTAYANCYCTPGTPTGYLASTSGFVTNGIISSVSLPGVSTTLSHSPSTTSTSPYYTNVPAATTTTTLNQGTGYTLTLNVGRTTLVAAWIDYDHSGTFDASEYLGTVSNTATTAATGKTIAFTVSGAASTLTGTTRLRIRSDISSGTTLNTATNGCLSTTNGETLDYTITLANPNACTAAPASVTATPSVATACAGTAFTLTASGQGAATSYVYQWQSSPAGAGTFSNITPSANATGTTTAVATITGQTVATDYRVLISCSAISGSAVTTSTTASVAQSLPTSCYCTPAASTSSGNQKLFPFALTPLNGTNPVFTTTSIVNNTTSPYYTNNTTAANASNPTGIINADGTYIISGSFANGARGVMWIDYNQNGLFEDSERTLLTGTTSTTFNFPYVVSFTVPAGAVTGATRMRIRTDTYSNTTLASTGNTAACATTGTGATTDYTVTVAATPTCVAGTVFTTIASSGFVSATATSGRAVTLTVTGIPAGAPGVTYQWQSRLNTAGNFNTFVDVAGQTAANYSVSDQAASTDYRAVVTCGGVPTPTTSITVRNDIEFIAPVYSNPGGEFIMDFKMPNAANGTGFDNNTGGSRSITSTTAAGYNDYTGFPNLTATLSRGIAYTGTSMTAFVNNGNSAGGMWIDYDHNGTFDTSEFTLLGSYSSNSGIPYTFPAVAAGQTAGFVGGNPISITVPTTATLGLTRVRVRWRNGTLTGADAAVGSYSATAGSNWYGETEDYSITIGDAANCTATPAALTITPSTANACANSALTLTSDAPTNEAGYLYQWYSRPSGGTFAPILAANGGTSATYTTTQTAAADYQLRLACTYGGSPVFSNILSVGQNTFDQCYGNCVLTHSSPACATAGAITNVTLNTLNNTSTCTGNTGYYTAYPKATATTSLNMSQTYSLSISNSTNAGVGYSYAVWIDYNHSATFEASEFIGGSASTTNAVSTVSFTVPVASGTVLGGDTRIRIATGSTNTFLALTANDGCAVNRVDGETEDYTITLVPQTACASPLPTFTAAANQTAACTATAIVLTATDNSASNLSGLTYQWQRRNSGSGTYADITGATTNPYTLTGQTVASNYRVVVTCSAGSTSTTSSNLVTVTQNGFLSCYCIPSNSNGGTIDMVASVTLGTLSNNTSAAGNATAPYYHDYSSLQPGTLAIPSLQAGNNATVTLTFGTDGNQYSAVWIDFNQNGTFDTSEYFTSGANAGASGTATITIAVPLAALAGQTKMRVRGGDDNMTNLAAGSACSTANSFGESEDYLVNILPATPCSGTPPITTVVANSPYFCTSGGTVTLSVTGVPTATSGFGYQWESRLSGSGSYAPISGATAATYTVTSQTGSTDYRLLLNCTNSGQGRYSNPITITNSFMGCYCQVPSSSVGEYLTNVAINGLNNASGSSTTRPVSGYADYSVNPTATQTTTLTRSQPYTITVQAQSNRNPSTANLWIDYNHNGLYTDAGEYTLIGTVTTIGPVTLTKSITVPMSALPGPTHMRVRWHNDNTNGTTGACETGWNGETEEYLINISDALVVSTTMGIPAGSYSSITVISPGIGTLAGAVSVSGAVVVQNGGTLNTECQAITGAGSFTLAAGGTLGICDATGLTAAGPVQTTGTRSFSTDANYIYNGVGAQVTGAALPAQVRNLTVANGDAVTLSQPVSVTQVVRLQSGDLSSSAANGLTLLSVRGSGTALIDNTGGSVTGTGVMQRAVDIYTPDNIGYHHYSSPVSNTTINDLQTPGFDFVLNPSYNTATLAGQVRPFPTVFGYDEQRLTPANGQSGTAASSPATDLNSFDKGFFSPTSGDAMPVGRGFTASVPNALTVDFAGTFNNGNVDVTGLTRGSDTESGWSFLGNPYPSPIDWTTMAAGQFTNVGQAAYQYHATSRYGGTYSTQLPSGVNLPAGTSNLIDAGAGFWVRVSTAGTPGALAMTNANRVTTFGVQPAFGRAANTLPQLVLQVRGAGGTDQAMVYTDAAATAGVDGAYDAAKLPNPSGLSLAMLSGTTPLAINGLPGFTTTTVVPLTLAVPAAGTYTFDVAQLANLGTTRAYLRDAVAGTETLLTATTQVPATLTTTSTTRFSLVFRPSGALATATNVLAAEASIYPNPARSQFALLLPPVAGQKEVQATLLNALGQVVTTRRIALNGAGATAEFNTASLARGVYVLRLQAGDQTATRRVVVE